MTVLRTRFFFFFFNDTATTEIYTLSLHDALPISYGVQFHGSEHVIRTISFLAFLSTYKTQQRYWWSWNLDRKSTRLNSSHLGISYAVFCLKKKKKKQHIERIYEHQNL